MNEKDILSLIKSECDEAAPDDFMSISKKISKPKHSISIFLKIAAAAAIFSLPAASVYISNHFNSIDHNRITIAERTPGSDTTAQLSDTYTETVSSSSASSKSTITLSETVSSAGNHTDNSYSTHKTSEKSPAPSDIIHEQTISTPPHVITEYISTDTVISTTTSLPPQITPQTTSIISSVSDKNPSDMSVPETSTNPPSDMDIPIEKDYPDMPTVTVTEQTTPVEEVWGGDDESENAPIEIKSFKLISPERFPECNNDFTIFKGTQYYYRVDYVQYYTVVIEYPDSSTEKITLSKAIVNKYVSIEQLIEAGLHVTIVDIEK